jgi:hypothetical protein
MFIQWIALGTIICFIGFSYIKHYPLKTRVTSIGILLLISLIFMLPVFSISILTLLGLFLFERLWILLALVLFIDMMLNKNKRTLMIILGIVSIIIYFYLRTMI